MNSLRRIWIFVLLGLERLKRTGCQGNDLNYYIPNHQQLEALHQPPLTITDLCVPICCKSKGGSSEERLSHCLILFRISTSRAVWGHSGLNSPPGDKGSPAWCVLFQCTLQVQGAEHSKISSGSPLTSCSGHANPITTLPGHILNKHVAPSFFPGSPYTAGGQRHLRSINDAFNIEMLVCI